MFCSVIYNAIKYIYSLQQYVASTGQV